jgi:hypothetical protein
MYSHALMSRFLHEFLDLTAAIILTVLLLCICLHCCLLFPGEMTVTMTSRASGVLIHTATDGHVFSHSTWVSSQNRSYILVTTYFIYGLMQRIVSHSLKIGDCKASLKISTSG